MPRLATQPSSLVNPSADPSHPFCRDGLRARRIPGIQWEGAERKSRLCAEILSQVGDRKGRLSHWPGTDTFFGYGTGDGSCKEHPAVGFGAKLGPVLLLKTTAAINNSVCFLQCLQIRRVNTSHRAFAFFSWPPPFSRDATEPGEGPCYSIALHFLSREESQVTPLLKNHAG